jgi:hypothetical protein
MTAKKRAAREKPARMVTSKSQTDPAVSVFLRRLNHPLKKEIEAVRRIILAASPRVRDGIKWNSLSFRTKDADYFATFNWRCREAVQLVFHKGAKVKDNTTNVTISDPKGLIKRLAKDRCLVTLGAGKDIKVNTVALTKIVREWIGQL